MTAPAPHEDAAPTTSSVGGTIRRLFVLAVALGMMVGLNALRVAPVDGSASTPATLAGIGFVLLAAFTVGELGASLGLPKVTGYIVAGAVLGPQVADILSHQVVDDMRTFNTLALGLIATTAGLELHLPAIRKVARTLLATVGLKIALLPLFVGVPLALAEHFYPSFGLVGWGPIAAFALVISVLGIGTSPAIALAVVNDAGSKGRLTDLLLGIAVVKDLVVVTCLAIAIAIAKAMLGGGSLEASVLVHLGVELGSSVLVGAIIGGLLILYFRFIRVEPLFSMFVTILLVAELAHTLHLELLLVFITAGFLVRNFSDYEHALHDPLERISLPVYVVFFTTAGAGVDLRATLAILPLALALVVLRVIAYALAGHLGGRIGKEAPPVAKNAWLTYVPQAGVTLGLVLLAAKALPELEGPITGLGLALVTINLLVGPVTLAIGLGRAGETAASRASMASDVGDAVTDEVPTDWPGEAPAGEAAAEPVPVELLDDPVLAALVQDAGSAVEAQLDAYVEASLVPISEALQRRARALHSEEDDLRARARRVKRAVADTPEWRSARPEGEAAAVFDAVVKELGRVKRTVEVPLDLALLDHQPADGRALAGQRAWARVGARVDRMRGREPVREVPARLVLRYALEPRLAESLAGVCAAMHRADAEVLSLTRRALSGVPVSVDDVTAVAARWLELARADLRRAVRDGLADASRRLARLGTPDMRARDLRFADVESRVEAALTRMGEDAPAWAQRCGQAEQALGAAAFVAIAERALASAVDARAHQPLQSARDDILPELDAVAARLEAVAERAAALTDDALDAAALERLAALCTEAVARPGMLGLRRGAARFRRQTQAGLLVRDLAEVVRNAPDRCSVIAPDTPLSRAARPEDVVVRELPLARLMDGQVHDDLLPAVAAALAPVVELVAAGEGRVREGAAVAGYGAHLAARGGFEVASERRQVVVDAIHRGARRVGQHRDELAAALDAAAEVLGEAEARATGRMADLLDVDPLRSGALVRQTLRTTLVDLFGRAGKVRVAVASRASELARWARALAEDKNVRDLRIRSGREQLDATAIRAYVRTHLAAPEERGLPATFVRLMAPAPVNERRLFTAREALLNELLAGLGGAPATAAPSTILVGAEGAGCTSLLLMVQMQLVGPRVLWLDQAFASRSEGPLGALATDLGVAPEPSLLADALAARPTVVLLDSVESWLEPGVGGVAALEALLDLIVETRSHTRWLLAMNAAAFALYDDAIDLRHRVTRVARLEPLDGAELGALVDRRARQGGFDEVYGAQRLRDRVRERLRPGRERDDYFKALAREARGNPGDALRIHLASVVDVTDERLRFGPPSLPSLPFVNQLPAQTLGLLAALLRYGQLGPRRLAAEVGCDEAEIGSLLGWLSHAGLIEARGQSGDAVGLRSTVAPALRRELEAVGLAGGGDA